MYWYGRVKNKEKKKKKKKKKGILFEIAAAPFRDLHLPLA